jgi:hypothetical protein
MPPLENVRYSTIGRPHPDPRVVVVASVVCATPTRPPTTRYRCTACHPRRWSPLPEVPAPQALDGATAAAAAPTAPRTPPFATAAWRQRRVRQRPPVPTPPRNTRATPTRGTTTITPAQHPAGACASPAAGPTRASPSSAVVPRVPSIPATAAPPRGRTAASAGGACRGGSQRQRCRRRRRSPGAGRGRRRERRT